MLTTRWFDNSVLEEQVDRFEEWYGRYIEFEGEPTTITVHEVWDQWGGPEEGGWTFRCGYPVETICIFSKEQAVKELIRLHSKYKEDEDKEYDISLDKDYARFYPEKRPHYE
jgi:hypothetical protein